MMRTSTCRSAHRSSPPSLLTPRPPHRRRAGRRRRRCPRRSAPRGCPARLAPAGGVVSVGAVREKRGAGAGWVTPSRSTKVLASHQVRVLERLGHRQHRRDAGVGARRRPPSTRPACGSRTASAITRRSLGVVGRVVAVGCGLGDAEQPDELGVELRLERRRPRGAGRRRSRRRRRRERRRRAGWPRAPRGSSPPARNAGGHGVEVGGAVDDRGVDDLALAGEPRLEEGGEDADDEVRRPAAEVADQVGREVRPSLGPGPSRRARR